MNRIRADLDVNPESPWKVVAAGIFGFVALVAVCAYIFAVVPGPAG